MRLGKGFPLFYLTPWASMGVQGSGTANEIAYWVNATTLGSLAVATYPSLTELSYVKGVTSAIQTQINAKAPSTSPTFATSITGSYLTASEILITDGSKNIVSAAVATYPSLTELSYVKGVTSAIQTQINTKANTAGALTQFVGNNNWKVFYSDGSGDVIELALGASGTVLTSGGVSSAPSFTTPSSGSPATFFINAGEFYPGTNVTQGDGNMRVIQTFADGVTGRASCSFMIPSGFTSISSIVARFRNGGATSVDVFMGFETSVNRVGSNDVTDNNLADAAYTVGSSAGAFQISIPSTAWDGLTSPLASGDIIGLVVERVGGNAADTLNATLEFEGVIVTLA